MRNCIKDWTFEKYNNPIYKIYMFEIVFNEIYHNIYQYMIKFDSTIRFMGIK